MSPENRVFVLDENRSSAIVVCQLCTCQFRYHLYRYGFDKFAVNSTVSMIAYFEMTMVPPVMANSERSIPATYHLVHAPLMALRLLFLVLYLFSSYSCRAFNTKQLCYLKFTHPSKYIAKMESELNLFSTFFLSLSLSSVQYRSISCFLFYFEV